MNFKANIRILKSLKIFKNLSMVLMKSAKKSTFNAPKKKKKHVHS